MPYICVQPTVDYIGVTGTVGVVWVCRRFDYSHFCRRFGVAVVTIDRHNLDGSTILVFSRSLRPTQSGHPSVGKGNECRQWFWSPLGKKRVSSA